MTGKLKDLVRGRDGDWVISVSTSSDPRELFDRLNGKIINIDLKEYKNHRSLDANGFAWALIDKIAAKMNLKKTEVYLNAIREIGGITGCVGVKDDFVESYIDAWKKNHIGRDAWVVPGSTKEGWSVVKVRLGSSDFDSLQMHRLIQILIQDAESLGIPTITEKEEQELISKWGKRNGGEIVA